MEDYFPQLEKWSVFAILKKFGIQTCRKEFNIVAVIGLFLGLLVTFLF